MMNCSLKQQQKTRGYKSIPHASAAADDGETTAVPVGASKWRVFLSVWIRQGYGFAKFKDIMIREEEVLI